MNLYMFHIQDFYGRTWHLDNLARWIYRDLISLYYQNEKPLVDDLNELAHKIRCRTDEEKTALREVLAEFFTLKKGKYHHSRIDREIKNYQYRRNKPAMIKRLTELGVEFDKSMSVAELASLLAMYDVDFSVTPRNESNDLRNESNGTSNEPSNSESNARNAMSNAERQALHRQKQRESLLLELQELGINPDKSMSLNGLKNLLEKTRNDLSNGTSNEPSNGKNLSNTESNGKNSAITNNQEPVNQSLSHAHTREVDDLTRFALPLDWQPSQNAIANLHMAGLGKDLTAYPLGLMKFCNYWSAEPAELTQAQWESKFVAALIDDKNRQRNDFAIAPTPAAPRTDVAQVQPHAPSKTKQSAMILSAVREKVVSGSLKTVLPPKICLAMIDGLLGLLGQGLNCPPAADVWELTLTTWANEFAARGLGDDDVANVQTAFQAAKRKATHPDNPEKRFPNAAEVLACLPMKLVQKQLGHKLSPEEWAEKAANGRAKTAELMKNIGKSPIQAA